MDIDELVRRLRDGERCAPDPGAVLAEVIGTDRARRRRRLVVQIGSAAAAVAVIAVTGTAVLATRSDTPARPPATVAPTAGPAVTVPPTAGPTVTPTGTASGGPTGTPSGTPTGTASGSPTATSVPAPPVTAADLAGYRWSTMPAAPIADRDQAALGWTGTEMLVWGGATDDGTTDVADGAAYNPATRSWRVLPVSPLDARIPQTSVWTGTEFIVWGGDHGRTDGAAYDPTTNTWRMLPAVPGPTAVGGTPEMPTEAVAAWTGAVVQLLTWRDQGSAVQSWSYSPSQNSWESGQSIQPKADARIGTAALLARGRELDAFVGWSYQDGSGGGFDKVTAVTRTDEDPRWRTVDYPALQRVGPLVDAGADIILGGGQPNVGSLHPSPAWMVPTQRLDPATATATALPDFPGIVDLGDYAIAWTGGALLGYGSDSYVEEPDGTKHLPGAAAAWDPATNGWTVLPAAPLAPYGTTPGVWTGTELLTWGLMYPPDQANTGHQKAAGAGLVLGPAG